MANATEQVLLKLTPGELAAIDGVRGDIPRTVWIKRLCADAVTAHGNLGAAEAVGASTPAAARHDARGGAAAELVEQQAPAGDPEDGPIGPHSTDAEVARRTAHTGQPCRCPVCTALRRHLRGWA